MANTIITKNSSTASSVPTSGDLVQGELAVNVTDKRLFTENAGGTVVELGTNPTTIAVAGNATVGGTLGVTGATTLAGASVTSLTNSGSTTLSGGTANGVAYLNGSKVVTSGSALTFDGTTLGINSGSTGLNANFNTTNASGVYVRFQNSGTSIGDVGAGGQLFSGGTAGDFGITSRAGSLVFGQNSTERMRLTSTGLGIGTSSPGYKLDVLGSATESGRFRTSGSINAFYLADSGTTAGSLYIGTVGNDFRIVTGSNETLRLTSSGNLGLGVTPSGWASFYKGFDVSSFGAFYSATINNAGFINNAYFNGTNWIYKNSSNAATNYQQTGGAHQWFTAPSGTAGNAISFTQAMTLDASGNLLVGTTARNYNDNASGSKFSSSGIWLSGTPQASGANMYLNQYSASGTTYLAYFMYNGVIKGSISSNGSTVAYNTTSDYRLKEDWIPVADASTRVKTLKPCNFAWKESGTRTDGFLAHELAEVIPDAVSGEKDAVDAEGNPVYQGIDQSKLVPLLTAALQEALAEIESLKARLDAANI